MLPGEQPEKGIDRRALSARFIEWRGGDLGGRYEKLAVRAYNVDVVCNDGCGVADFGDGHACHERQDLGQIALVFRIEMKNDDVGRASVAGKCFEKKPAAREFRLQKRRCP